MRLYPETQFFDNNGDPLNGGLIYTSVTGTSTPLAAYTTAAGGTTHSNPIVLDSYGRFDGGSVMLWLSPDSEYRLVIKTSGGTTIKTIDNVSGINVPTYEAYLTHNLKFATGRGLLDDSANEQITLTKTSNAVNYVNVTNAATGNGPTVAAAGDDSNVALNLTSKGTGNVNITGTAVAVTGNATVSGTLTPTGAFKPVINGAFHAYATVGTACANNTATEVVNGTESFDANSFHNTTTGRYTPTTAGYYQFSATGGFNTCDAACSIGVLLCKNGTAFASSNIRTEAANKLGIASVSGRCSLNGTTDYVSVFLVQDGGSSETSVVSSVAYQTFSGNLIAGT